MTERNNQRIYRQADTVAAFASAHGWVSPGEEVALLAVAAEIRSKRVLDIGVGAGRTVSLLSLLTDDYVGIDYSPEMVAICNRRYPNKDIRVEDARSLSSFQDRCFDFVLFSFNGIDSVDEDDRRKVFCQVHRVLDNGGLFLFSTLNKDGRSYNESPFQIRRPGQPWDRSLKAAALLLWRNGADPLRFMRRYKNWMRTRRQLSSGEGWAISALSITDFTLMNHFVTAKRLQEEISATDFEVRAIYGSDDVNFVIGPEEVISTADWFYAVAKKSEVR